MCVCERAFKYYIYFIFEFILDFKSKSINYSNLVFIISACVCVCESYFLELLAILMRLECICLLLDSLTHYVLFGLARFDIVIRRVVVIVCICLDHSVDFFWSEEFN